MNRLEIIQTYRNRIKEEAQTKLTSNEQEFLIRTFVKDLMKLKTEGDIKSRCQEEIALLEEGYPQQTVAKTRLNRYRKAIQEAVYTGRLKLTKKNSKQYVYDKKKGTEKTGEVCEAHHHFAWLYMCYDNDTYLRFNGIM